MAGVGCLKMNYTWRKMIDMNFKMHYRLKCSRFEVLGPCSWWFHTLQRISKLTKHWRSYARLQFRYNSQSWQEIERQEVQEYNFSGSIDRLITTASVICVVIMQSCTSLNLALNGNGGRWNWSSSGLTRYNFASFPLSNHWSKRTTFDQHQIDHNNQQTEFVKTLT